MPKVKIKLKNHMGDEVLYEYENPEIGFLDSVRDTCLETAIAGFREVTRQKKDISELEALMKGGPADGKN